MFLIALFLFQFFCWVVGLLSPLEAHKYINNSINDLRGVIFFSSQ